MSKRAFPDEFMWGVATSAQQIEGAAGEDGRGESIWDRFAVTPGNILDASDSTIACDHYHRWREDVALLQELGIGAYRFSIAWPRILPTGRRSINAAGIGFYDALVDALLEAEIRPFPTLYHWDLPQALQDMGGWGHRDTVDAFVEYAEVITSALGDRVQQWVTHNEPWCIACLGHEQGQHAPGARDPGLALRVAHHVLLSHGKALQSIRARLPKAEVGIVLIVTPGTPATASEADQEAVRQFDAYFNRWYLDPLYRGCYPEDGIAGRQRLGHLTTSEPSFVRPGDLETICAPMDFLGVNYYSRAVLKMSDFGTAERVQVAPAHEQTDMGWEIYPEGLETVLCRLHQEYHVPRIYITENGAAYGDEPSSSNTRLADLRRIYYLDTHLRAAHRAIAAGVPLAGYFVWSLMDNFEWGHGYTKNFGLYSVDFATQERRARDSAHWYKKVVAANAVAAETQKLG